MKKSEAKFIADLLVKTIYSATLGAVPCYVEGQDTPIKNAVVVGIIKEGRLGWSVKASICSTFSGEIVDFSGTAATRINRIADRAVKSHRHFFGY